MAHVILLLALVVGCGAELSDPDTAGSTPGGKSDGDGSPPGGLSARGFLERIGRDQCDRSFACRARFPDGDAAFVQVFGADAAACYASVDAFYRPGTVELQVGAGTIEYSADAASACLADTTYGDDCDEYWDDGIDFDAACDDALSGTVMTGGACATIFDCADSDDACDLDAGVCAPI